MNCKPGAIDKKAKKSEYDRARYAAKKAEHEAVHGKKSGPNQHTVSHRMTRTPEYRSWQAMRSRCQNPNDKDFSRYGSRGINVCKEWESFENFYADMGPRPAGTTVERKDNNGPYCPQNCRWATPLEQTRNRKNSITVDYQGEAHHLIDLCNAHGADYSTVHSRIFKHGWPVDMALTLPKNSRRRN
jgi:hypothetical protein